MKPGAVWYLTSRSPAAKVKDCCPWAEIARRKTAIEKSSRTALIAGVRAVETVLGCVWRLQQARPPTPLHMQLQSSASTTRSEDELLLSSDQNPPVVIGGSFRRLLYWVIFEQQTSAHVQAFLYTYRIHVTAEELWQALMRLKSSERIHSATEQAVFYSFVLEWVQTCYDVDFARKAGVTQLLSFVASSGMSPRDAYRLKLACVKCDLERGRLSKIRRCLRGRALHRRLTTLPRCTEFWFSFQNCGLP